jgi:hypothetical protein
MLVIHMSTYEAIIGDDLLGVGAGDSRDGTQWLGQATGCQAVNVILLLSDLRAS